MAHNIEFNKGRKSHSLFVVREPAWHRLGTVVNEALTSTEAIETANLDYEVGVGSVYMKYKADDMFTNDKGERLKGKSIGNTFATYRRDNGTIFGTVGSKYTPIQNKNAFDFFDSIVGGKLAMFETAGALGDGRTIFITAKLHTYIRMEKDKDDIIQKYLLLTNTHDVSSSIQITFIPIRVVCNNTLNAALQSSKNILTIRHTASAHDKLERAMTMLQIVDTRSNEIAELYNRLSNVNIDYQTTQKFLAKLLLTRDKEFVIAQDKLILHKDEISTRKMNIFNDINRAIYEGVGQDMAATKDTLFGVYNGVSYYFQNVKSYTTDNKANYEKMFNNNYVSGGIDTIQQSLNLAYHASKDITILNN